MGKGRADSSVQTAAFLINPRTKRRGSGGVPRRRSRLCLAPVLRAWLVPTLWAGRGLTGLCRVLRALPFVTADLCDHALHIPHDEL